MLYVFLVFKLFYKQMFFKQTKNVCMSNVLLYFVFITTVTMSIIICFKIFNIPYIYNIFLPKALCGYYVLSPSICVCIFVMCELYYKT